MVSQREHLSSDTVLKSWLELLELPFGGRNDLDTVFHLSLRSFLILARKVRNERDLSWLRASAMARSIKSSLNSWSCTILANMASCSAGDSARKAVIKISATASLGLIRITSFSKKDITQRISYIGEDVKNILINCQVYLEMSYFYTIRNVLFLYL